MSEINAVVLYVTDGDDASFTLLQRTTGRKIDLPADPKLSPDRPRLVTADFCERRCTNELALWRVTPRRRAQGAVVAAAARLDRCGRDVEGRADDRDRLHRRGRDKRGRRLTRRLADADWVRARRRSDAAAPVTVTCRSPIHRPDTQLRAAQRTHVARAAARARHACGPTFGIAVRAGAARLRSRVRPPRAARARDRVRHGRDHRDDRAGAAGRGLPRRRRASAGRGQPPEADRRARPHQRPRHPARCRRSRRGDDSARHRLPASTSSFPTRGRRSAITSGGC